MDLFWKRMRKHIFLSCEEKHTSEFKIAKNCLILLLDGNANGDFKLKTLLVYHSKTLRAIKGISKSSLPVIWYSNKKSLITTKIVQNWFTKHFCPSVKWYWELIKQGIASLLIDNVQSHPTHLSHFITCIPSRSVNKYNFANPTYGSKRNIKF